MYVVESVCVHARASECAQVEAFGVLLYPSSPYSCEIGFLCEHGTHQLGWANG